MKKIDKNLLLMILFSIAFGFVAGILGFISLGSGAFTLPFLGSVEFSDTDLDRQIVIDQPRNVVVDQDLQLKQIENDLLPTLVNVYLNKTSQQLLNKAYLDTEQLGHGFVLTADGWIVTTDQVVKNLNGKYVVFGYQNKKYEMDNLILDEATGLVFGKAEAQSLPVSKIGRSNELFVGQTLVLASDRDKLDIVHISKIGYEYDLPQAIVQSSDELSKQLWLDIDLKEYDGSVLTNLKGEIVGVVNNSQIILVDYFRNIIGQVLDNQKIERASLNIDYIDLSQVEGLLEYGDKGALVYTVPAKSPAYGKLKKDDVIKKVDDIEINSYQSLSELINTYKKGNSIELLVARGNQEITLDITLD